MIMLAQNSTISEHEKTLVAGRVDVVKVLHYRLFLGIVEKLCF